MHTKARVSQRLGKPNLLSRPLFAAFGSLGARLATMINVRSIARELDFGFRFVWRRFHRGDLFDSRQLFSRDFPDAFESTAIDPASITSDFHPGSATALETRRQWSARPAPSSIENFRTSICDGLSSKFP